jgi:site-specific DNA recombinase
VNIQLDEAGKRLSKARNLLLAGDFEANDYRLIKSETEERINRLEAQLRALVTDTTNIESLWDKAIRNISQLDILYKENKVIHQLKITSLMFPEKLTFDEFHYRTTRLNVASDLVCLIENNDGLDKQLASNIVSIC